LDTALQKPDTLNKFEQFLIYDLNASFCSLDLKLVLIRCFKMVLNVVLLHLYSYVSIWTYKMCS